MSAPGRSRAAVLLKAAGVVALAAILRPVLDRGRPARRDPEAAMRRTERETRPMERSQDSREGDGAARRRETTLYLVGYGLALALTGTAFALVHWRWASGSTALGLVFALALTQAVVHFRCFLHIDLRRNARDDLQLLLFSTLIVLLMVGGTLVVLFNLRQRMM